MLQVISGVSSNLQSISSPLLFQLERRTEEETLACVLASIQGSMGGFGAPTVKRCDYHSVSSSHMRIIGFMCTIWRISSVMKALHFLLFSLFLDSTCTFLLLKKNKAFEYLF